MLHKYKIVKLINTFIFPSLSNIINVTFIITMNILNVIILVVISTSITELGIVMKYKILCG